MNTLLKFVPFSAVCAVVSAGLALAAELPKEGKYDFTSCSSGVVNAIAFSETHSAFAIEETGATLSNPPGGMFDHGSFHCVGLRTMFEGKLTQTGICEATYPDGGKVLVRITVAPDGNSATREVVAGTGKYEGSVASGTITFIRPFPVLKPGTFQLCTHQAGTYKLK